MFPSDFQPVRTKNTVCHSITFLTQLKNKALLVVPHFHDNRLWPMRFMSQETTHQQWSLFHAQFPFTAARCIKEGGKYSLAVQRTQLLV